MPFKIILMTSTFLAGIILDHFKIIKKTGARKVLHQIATVYLLFKIGFFGGSRIMGTQWQLLIAPVIVAIIISSLWTFLVLILLKRWSSFEPITQISIATHFGSVSIGTFIAATTFLEALQIKVNPNGVIWLALMEFPAILIGMWKLGVRANMILPIVKEKWTLTILPISIVLGALFGTTIPSSFKTILFGIIFTPILLYFLFEMGAKASGNLHKLKKNIGSVFFVGVAIPILGGITGSSLGYCLGYDTGGMFILAILMASGSYVLAPLCMQEVLKSIYKPNMTIAKEVVSTSIALSVGVTLPFNIAIGFPLYYFIIKSLQANPNLALLGLSLPVILVIVSLIGLNPTTVRLK